MNRKHIQLVLWAFAILGSVVLLGSQASAKMPETIRTGKAQEAAVVSGGGTSAGVLPASSPAGGAPLNLSCSTANFGPATWYGAGTRPVGMAVGDFDRDGRLDLAVANQNSNNVTVRWGDGS